MDGSALLSHSGTWDYDSHPQRIASKFTLVKAFLVSEERERTEFQSLRFALKQARQKLHTSHLLTSIDKGSVTWPQLAASSQTSITKEERMDFVDS